MACLLVEQQACSSRGIGATSLRHCWPANPQAPLPPGLLIGSLTVHIVAVKGGVEHLYGTLPYKNVMSLLAGGN